MSQLFGSPKYRLRNASHRDRRSCEEKERSATAVREDNKGDE